MHLGYLGFHWFRRPTRRSMATIAICTLPATPVCAPVISTDVKTTVFPRDRHHGTLIGPPRPSALRFGPWPWGPRLSVESLPPSTITFFFSPSIFVGLPYLDGTNKKKRYIAKRRPRHAWEGGTNYAHAVPMVACRASLRLGRTRDGPSTMQMACAHVSSLLGRARRIASHPFCLPSIPPPTIHGIWGP